jgi:predicted DNA binding protein
MKYLLAQNFAAPSMMTPSVSSSIKSYEKEMKSPLNNSNIMIDPRICRGNTYTRTVLTDDQRRNRDVYEREQTSKRRLLERKSLRVSSVLQSWDKNKSSASS